MELLLAENVCRSRPICQKLAHLLKSQNLPPCTLWHITPYADSQWHLASHIDGCYCWPTIVKWLQYYPYCCLPTNQEAAFHPLSRYMHSRAVGLSLCMEHILPSRFTQNCGIRSRHAVHCKILEGPMQNSEN